ncbi:hypothetical protein C0J52_09132, partial [Blattella germanica]
RVTKHLKSDNLVIGQLRHFQLLLAYPAWATSAEPLQSVKHDGSDRVDCRPHRGGALQGRRRRWHHGGSRTRKNAFLMSDSSSQFLWIGLGVFGGLLLILVVVLLACSCAKNLKRSGDEEFQQQVTNMEQAYEYRPPPPPPSYPGQGEVLISANHSCL